MEFDWLAAALLAWAQSEPGPLLVNESPRKFRDLFVQGLVALSCGEWGFASYSLRRGGAAELWHRFGALGCVTLRGRWAQPATAHIYINDGFATLAGMRLPEAWCKRFRCPMQLFTH